MSAPNLSIQVQPSVGKAVVYLLLAPRKDGAPSDAQLSLRLRIENNESAPVHVSAVRLLFTDPPAPFEVIPVDLDIASGATKSWNFATADNVLLPVPVPQQMTVELLCQGFSEPAKITRPLAHHESPVPGKSYRFPARAEDLRPGEHWIGRSAVHGPAGGGVQLFGYDLGVVHVDTGSRSISYLLPGGDFGTNEDYRIWGKPICAMADGTVVAFDDDQPTNPDPPDDLSPPGPVEGNHFYIQHGDELMLYAHLQKGTLPQELLSVGAKVTAGQPLGLAGNSGNSTAPHLHIHAIRGTSPWNGPPHPIPLHGVRVLDGTEAVLSGPGAEWSDVVRRGLPSVSSLIHPDRERGRRWDWRAVDPLSLILAHRIYVKLTLPDPPPEEILRERIRAQIDAMSREERRHAVEETKKLRTYVDALEKELRGGR